jgi:outer membrane protein assembly factor BamB
MSYLLTRGGCFAAIFLFLSPGITAAADRTDWPQFLGPMRNGVYAGPELAKSWPAGGPKVVWKREVGQGFAGPAVAEGKLILFHRLGGKERVECLDAKSGQPLWSGEYPTAYADDFGFDEGPRGTPAIADGRVFTFGADGVLSCWNLADGKRAWEVDTKTKFRAPKGFFGPACSPLIEGGAVVLNVGGANGAGVVAFDCKSGKVLWKATDDPAGYASPVAATVGGKRTIFAFTRSGLDAIDPAGGRVLFQFPWRSRMDASVNAAAPLVIHEGNDDLVFLSASYGTGATLLRLDPRDLTKPPEQVWSGDESLSNHYATSVHREGFLYGFHGRQEHGPSLRCVELRTGKVRWSEDGFGAGTILLAGDRLLVLTEKGQLVLAPATPEGWQATAKAQILPFECRAYPALADGLLYARSKDRMVCVDLR